MLSETQQSMPDGMSHDMDDVSRVSNEFMNAAAGNAEGSARDPGLLITTEDIRRIRQYVNRSLALPTDIAQVRQLLGDDSDHIAGLGAEDIRQLYLGIHEHAASWAGLEADMRSVGQDMHVFAGNLVSTAEDMVAFIKGLDSWSSLKLGDLTADQVGQMPAVELAAGDRKQLPGLLALVAELKLYIGDHRASSARVKVGVEAFKKRLRDSVRPGVALKIELARSADSSERSARLREDIERLNERIDQKADEYEEFCKYRWVGFWWGPIGGAISWSIYGPKAAQTLEEKAALLSQKSQLEKELRQLSGFMSELVELETSLQDLRVRIDGATSSASNIESLWALLEEYADSSYKRIENMDNALFLVIFVTRLNVVLTNWANIRKQALDLLTAFDKAIGETAR